MLVISRVLTCLLQIQVIIVLLGLFVKACDVDGNIRNMFPDWISDHEKTSYYIAGLVLFLAILGLIGLVCSFRVCRSFFASARCASKANTDTATPVLATTAQAVISSTATASPAAVEAATMPRHV